MLSLKQQEKFIKKLNKNQKIKIATNLLKIKRGLQGSGPFFDVAKKMSPKIMKKLIKGMSNKELKQLLKVKKISKKILKGGTGEGQIDPSGSGLKLSGGRGQHGSGTISTKILKLIQSSPNIVSSIILNFPSLIRLIESFSLSGQSEDQSVISSLLRLGIPIPTVQISPVILLLKLLLNKPETATKIMTIIQGFGGSGLRLAGQRGRGMVNIRNGRIRGNDEINKIRGVNGMTGRCLSRAHMLPPMRTKSMLVI